MLHIEPIALHIGDEMSNSMKTFALLVAKDMSWHLSVSVRTAVCGLKLLVNLFISMHVHTRVEIVPVIVTLVRVG